MIQNSLRGLIDMLQEHLAGLENDEDLEVAVAFQPSWPLAGRIHGVWKPEVAPEDYEGHPDDVVDPDDAAVKDAEGVGRIWIVIDQAYEVGGSPYANPKAWEEMERFV